MIGRLRCATFYSTILSACLSVALPAPGALLDEESTQFDVYRQTEGDSPFALSLRVEKEIPAPAESDVLILFDTSATQAGIYREMQFSSLQTLLNNLSDNDRVRLYAVDLQAVEMTAGFVPPRGAEIRRAIKSLESRVPLGATDLTALLDAATNFEASSKHAHAAVYLGDGVSSAGAVDTDEVRAAIDKLVAAKVSLSSYAVGPRVDALCLAAVANQTGGNLHVHGDIVW
ncbi:MAG: hypothetical protein KDA42_19725, partial [Planctomycetales bacterium]|nr:hypothetical protein [Planctomycetales bacterium]